VQRFEPLTFKTIGKCATNSAMPPLLIIEVNFIANLEAGLLKFMGMTWPGKQEALS
jgi:hypothetical protein